MKKKFEFFTLKRNDTPGRNTLTAIELKDYVDFEVKRVYTVTNFKVRETGQHCHFEEKEFFVVVQGKATAVVDRGNGLEEFLMSSPSSAIYVPNYIWHGFKDISDDAVILALSSTNYRSDRSDYLDNYDEYLKIRDEKLNESR